jgi:hypothetical protein
LTILAAACGGSKDGGPGPGSNPDNPDAPMVFMDAPPVVPTTIKLSGTATEQGQSGSTPLAGAAIALFKIGDDANPLATATSDAQGNYMLSADTNGDPLDGYIRATKSSYADTFSYPARAWVADATGVDANMLSSNTYGLLVLFAGASSSNGMVTLVVTDSSGTAVQGATVASDPVSREYKYSDSNGQPNSDGPTAADGLAFMFDAPPGDLKVSATKSGMTFHAHTINARAGKFTTTLVSQ